MGQLPPPHTYADWSALLDRLDAGLDDDAVLQAMAAGTIAWTAGVANLFAERMGAVVDQRLTRCSERLTRDLNAAAGEPLLVRAILNARQSLSLLHRLASLPVFPAMLRDHLVGEVRKFADRAQQSLEDSARHDRTGRIASTLRHNNLQRYDGPPAATLPPSAHAPSVAPPPALPGGVRRRNILG